MSHHHGYLWNGPKAHFDQEGLRRPPHPDPPPAGSRPELVLRYREVVAEFPASGLPPLETAHWLLKPQSLIRGTWPDPREAATWLGERLAEYAPRFDSAAYRDTTYLALLISSAADRLGRGDDVSLGFYLERPVFLSLALVACSTDPTNTGPAGTPSGRRCPSAFGAPG
ncbi:hypothetical protein ACPXCE_10240 [Streptomyces sp. DT24]|uniref:hypothetical protein n=1 Tax=unclassified Streptomyces TaxID=2593676 RepID=UPI0023B8D992|nr:hypothetical protein [Streptomyces sp. AM 4-1-1]WEH34669.1 hypothetical protein PZB75_15710 [Streptomyces sp. AM 4-1-1]